MNVIDCYILLCYHDDGFAAESAVVYILAVIHVCVWVPTHPLNIQCVAKRDMGNFRKMKVT